MTRAARFRQADLERALRGAEKGGMKVGQVEIDPSGRIVIKPLEATPPKAANSWDSFE